MPADPRGLKASYSFCAASVRRSAHNFAYSFVLMPKALRGPMHALYAFFRQTDDLADNPKPAAERRADLIAWRDALDVGLIDGRGDWPGMPALADAVRRRAIPSSYLHAVIDGAEMDLNPTGFETFADLELYCRRVASAVGLCCLHLWGFRSEGGRAESLAHDCGLALQLTNILRDVREDARDGRVYLPREELRRFGVLPDELTGPRLTPALRDLFRHQAERAKTHYERAAPLAELVDPAGRPTLRAMVGIYRGLLGEIIRRDYDVLSGRVRLSRWAKLGLAWRAWRG